MVGTGFAIIVEFIIACAREFAAFAAVITYS
jgi:hypothetical protein